MKKKIIFLILCIFFSPLLLASAKRFGGARWRPARHLWLLILLAGGGAGVRSQTPGEWTWMHGDNTSNPPGVFGVQGATNATNKPPALYEPYEWTDLYGNFWLFGGGNLNGVHDALWKYDPVINQWTWMKGSSAINQSGIYGIQGLSAPGNNPGARGYGAVSWVDASGDFWLFGGYGYDAVGGVGILNDLWKYDPDPASPTYNQWTWVNGPNTVNDPGTYGAQGISAAANVPPSRCEISCSWTDNTGNLWLYGGSSTTSGNYSDLWKYNISINEWTWVHGANTINAPAVYGAQGLVAPANTPGGRWIYASWKDLSGNLWLFGGGSFATTYNDLWKYDIASNQWAWIKGPNTINDPGNYGTKCVRTVTNIPPAKWENRACVRDMCGNFWNFGGTGSSGDFNDLWHYNIATNEWTWVSGDNTTNQAGVFGVRGTSNPANKPEAKRGSVSWTGNTGHIWIFGGRNGTAYLNDLFRYVPDPSCIPSSAVIAVSPNTSVCFGQSATLTASGGTSYSWSPSGQNTSSIVVSPPFSATYTVIGSNGCGSDTASVTVAVFPLPSITASFNTTICSGQNATLTASGGTNYVWAPVGQSTSAVLVNPTATTTYTVIGRDANNCTNTSAATVAVNNTPIATVWNSVTITAGSSTTLNSNSNPPAITYNWSPATGLSCVSCQNPIANPIATTTYCITVTDNNGCTNTACLTVTIEDPCSATIGELYLPNAFSPNNDGENDEFCLQGDNYCVKELTITIYDRWGEKVYTSDDPAFCWDGFYQGKLMNTAVFVYYLEATLISGNEIIKKGNISLVR